MQILRNTQATLAMGFSEGNSTTGVQVSVTDERGAVVSTGTATQVGAPGNYTYLLPPQPQLSRLTAAWSGTWASVAQTITDDHEIVGGYLFTIAEVRAFGNGELADETEYPDASIRAKRDSIADDFQKICDVSFFPRYEHEFFDGTGKARLWLPFKKPLSVISVHVDGVAYSAGQLAALKPYKTGRIENPAGWPGGSLNVEVEWSRGWQVVPEPIKEVAVAYAHYKLLGSEITDRMVTFANELGTVRLSVPGAKNPTGLPVVDSVLNRFDETDRARLAIH